VPGGRNSQSILAVHIRSYCDFSRVFSTCSSGTRRIRENVRASAIKASRNIIHERLQAALYLCYQLPNAAIIKHEPDVAAARVTQCSLRRQEHAWIQIVLSQYIVAIEAVARWTCAVNKSAGRDFKRPHVSHARTLGTVRHTLSSRRSR
jgi:hypothetical protein